jgi:hypothetical protein
LGETYRLEKAGTDRLLALTGVQTIGKLRPYWEKHTCWFRVLERETSITLAQEQGFPKGNLVFYHAGESEALLLETLHPQAILTKESGESGGFSEKVKAAQAAKIPVFAIKRPPLPRHFMIVTGEYGLRKQIEKNIPAFYPLRSGYTTGACATAAAKAALTALILGEEQKMISFRLPDDEEMTLPVAHTEIEKNSATCTVVKDAGDDPDVTHGASIVVTVSFSNHPGCTEEDMAELAVITKKLDFHLEQVQDFTPTPMTVSTEAWYTGVHPYTLEPVFSAKTPREKLAQRMFFFWYKPEERKAIINELRKIGRNDLINKLYGKS